MLKDARHVGPESPLQGSRDELPATLGAEYQMDVILSVAVRHSAAPTALEILQHATHRLRGGLGCIAPVALGICSRRLASAYTGGWALACPHRLYPFTAPTVNPAIKRSRNRL